MPNESFKKDLEKNLPHPLYFLWGKENFLLEEAQLSATLKVIPRQHMDFNYDVFEPSAVPQDILNAACSFPFMVPRRLVILKDFHDFSGMRTKVLIPYFKKPSETTCMIIFSRKEPKKNIDAVWRIYNMDIKESNIRSWVKQTAADKGIKLTGSAVDYLIESLGPDAGLLSAEIEKLTFSGLKDIDEKDIISSTGMMREYTPFNLIDAITAGEKKKAFRILKSLKEKKSSDATAVLGPLNWHYSQFYTLWENKGERPQKMNDYKYRILKQHIPFFTLEKFRNIFKNLHEADILIKSSGRPDLALEILLIKLLQIGTKN